MIIKIFASAQQLILEENDTILRTYTVSTASKGLGQSIGSEMTPKGWHQIKVKIGDNSPINTVFKGRRKTGEIYTPQLGRQFPDRDWILTRILWLSGLEPGVNRYGANDTLKRYIYLHGCPDELPVGIPLSHGCIRLHNHDIVDLFELVSCGTRVLITE